MKDSNYGFVVIANYKLKSSLSKVKFLKYAEDFQRFVHVFNRMGRKNIAATRIFTRIQR